MPQPLLPAEIALTSDTGEAWIGQDPALAVASINVYSNKETSLAQSIVNTGIVESKFDADFAAGAFASMVTELKGNATVTLVDEDILWDNTFRGVILSVTGSGGSGYTGGGDGVGDLVTAISPSGSGFIGWVDTVDGGNAILTIVVTSGGQNYSYTNTTFTVANGTGATVSVAVGDIHGSTVHIAADTNIDVDNTVAQIITEVAGLSVAGQLISSAAYGGTFVAASIVVNNHTEAANVVALINRVNSTSPNQITGLVYTNLNIELTTNQNEPVSFQLAASDLVTALTISTNNAYFRMPRGMEVQEVRGSLLSVSTVGAVTIDINKNGATILSTKLTIDQDEFTSVTAATPPVIIDGDEIFADDDEITIDIDGGGTGALGLIVTLIGIA